MADDTTLLTLDRIFDSGEFQERGLGEYRWSRRTASYFTFETPQTGGKGRDLVRNDAATGRKEIVVPASNFVPEGESEPLAVESFELSADESKSCSSPTASESGDATHAATTGRWIWPRANSGSLAATPHPPRSCSPSSRPTALAWPTCGRTTFMSRNAPDEDHGADHRRCADGH